MKQEHSTFFKMSHWRAAAKTLLLLIAAVTVFSPGLVRAGSSDSISLSFTPRDIWPPIAVTNLSALAGSGEGEVQLTWTAPYEDNAFPTSGAVSSYEIRYDTFSIDSLGGDTTTWWSLAAGAYIRGFAQDPGQLESQIISNLPPGTTLYFALKSYDDVPNESEIDVRAATPGQQAWARVTAIPPAAITDLFASPGSGEGEIDLAWTTPGDDGWVNQLTGLPYTVKYDTRSVVELGGTTTTWWEQAAYTYPQGWAALVPGVWDNTHWLAGLTPGTTYYIAIRATDDASNEAVNNNVATAWAQAIADYPPAAPTGLVAKAGNRRVTLTWTENSEPDMKSYWVYRSTTSGSYDVAIATVTHPTTKYIDTGLTNEVIYYYVLRAVDEAANVSNPSYEVSARPSLRPREPCGVKGTLVDGGKYIKIEWKAVTRNEDGSACTDLEEYRIYRSTSLAGFGVDPSTTVAKSILTWTETENIIGKTYYYRVRAVDSNGVESVDSMTIMVQDEKVYVIALSEDMQARVIIPEELTDILYEQSSSYGDDLNITVEEVEEEKNKNKVISCYEFSAFKGYGNETPEEIESFSFAKPKSSVSISYEVNSAGTVKGTNIKASQAGKNLALFWFNGIEWVKLGAKTDTDEQVLWIRTKKLGKYKIKEAFAATEFTLNKVYPRIFTPNNDGLNDVVNFEYANPNEKGVVCRIFDIRGALVRQLDIGQTETSFAWDGKDEKGKVAPSGVYIYQLEGERKVINGTVILAK